MYHNQEIMTSWKDSGMTKEEYENKQLKDLVIEDENNPLVILSESDKLRTKLNEINKMREQGYVDFFVDESEGSEWAKMKEVYDRVIMKHSLVPFNYKYDVRVSPFRSQYELRNEIVKKILRTTDCIIIHHSSSNEESEEILKYGDGTGEIFVIESDFRYGFTQLKHMSFTSNEFEPVEILDFLKRHEPKFAGMTYEQLLDERSEFSDSDFFTNLAIIHYKIPYERIGLHDVRAVKLAFENWKKIYHTEGK